MPLGGKGLLFGGCNENGQNEAKTDGSENCDAKISAGQGITAHRRRNDEGSAAAFSRCRQARRRKSLLLLRARMVLHPAYTAAGYL